MNWEEKILRRDFYRRDTEVVARELLGKFLVRTFEGQILVGKIVETEAYLPFGDPAAHNFKGRTKRNESQYKDAGHAYVHSMHGHCLLDIVTNGPDIPGSVLVRAVEPIEGIADMKRLRREAQIEKLTNGPGKICCAFLITKHEDGIDLTDHGKGLFVARGETENGLKTNATPRIGISNATDLLLRFHLYQNAFVSRRR